MTNRNDIITSAGFFSFDRRRVYFILFIYFVIITAVVVLTGMSQYSGVMVFKKCLSIDFRSVNERNITFLKNLNKLVTG